ncbi:hypothetical protein NPIL_454701 [Nephila pilipes]|uniref:Uncharacterized protein n=1 Tax=Nephila pilipes TaxID=299642 RepID=A0A8X6NCX0_NEPPI|nr:hypothetical protein NPIL_454701 [Nephila pilipes]
MKSNKWIIITLEPLIKLPRYGAYATLDNILILDGNTPKIFLGNLYSILGKTQNLYPIKKNPAERDRKLSLFTNTTANPQYQRGKLGARSTPLFRI